MRAQHAVRLSLVTVLLVTNAGRADACSCITGIPVCEIFWKTPVVFSGEVLEIIKEPPIVGARAVYGTLIPPTGRSAEGYRIILRSDQHAWETTTDPDGRYAFGRIPIGTYHLSVVAGPQERVYGEGEVQLRDPRACAGRDLRIER